MLTTAATLWRTHRLSLLLAGILVLALGLRVWGIGFGLPNLEHPDEDAVLMPAMIIMKTGNLEPERMEYGTLHIYLLTAVSVLVFLRSAQNGASEAVERLQIYSRNTYPAIAPHPEYFLAARLLSAAFGVGIVLLTYMLVQRLTNRRLALFAAAAAAVLPALVTHAHFATTDTPLTFFCLLALYLLVRVYDNWDADSGWAYAGAGLVCGLAASTKLNGAVLMFPLVLVPLLHSRRLDDLLSFRTLIGPIMLVVGFFVGTPYALLNLPKFLFWSGYALRLYGHAPVGAEPVGTSWQWHLDYHLTSPNIIIVALGAIGFCLSWRRWGKRGWLINSFALLLWLAIIGQSRREARMWLPTAPIFIAWAALTVDWLVLQLQARWQQAQWQRQVGVVLPVLLLLPLLLLSARIAIGFQQPDVRSLAAGWIESNVPPGNPLLVEYFAPNVDTVQWPTTRVFNAHDRPVAEYTDAGIRYFVLSEAGNDPSKMAAEAWDRRQAFIAQACLRHTVSGPFLSNPSITMWVYEAPPCN